MQQPVDVVEDIPLADLVVAVVGAEAVQRPAGDIFAAVAAVLVVGVEGEALGLFKGQIQGGDHVCCKTTETFSTTNAGNTDDPIRHLRFPCWENPVEEIDTVVHHPIKIKIRLCIWTIKRWRTLLLQTVLSCLV